MSIRKAAYPIKRSMNLYYKPDRTTKPATIALYVLFAAACLLGLSKPLVYDLWMETDQARQTLAAAEDQLSAVMLELADFSEVQERYQIYSPTDEERELVDRMEVLALLDEAVGTAADMEIISINGDLVRIQFSEVTLAQTSRILHALEASPIVADTEISTASTTEETAANVSAPVQANVQIYLQKEAAE